MTESQIHYDPVDLLDQNKAMNAAEAHRIMLGERNKDLRRLRREGIRAFGWALHGQIRKYRALGVPDGSVRTVYMISQSHSCTSILHP